MATANVSPNSSCEQPARRALLGGIAAAGAVADAGASVEAAIEDPHIAWVRELDLIEAHLSAEADRSDEQLAPFHAERRRVEELIRKTPAQTMPGVIAQLRMAHAVIGYVGSMYIDQQDLTALANAVATLEQMAGRAPL